MAKRKAEDDSDGSEYNAVKRAAVSSAISERPVSKPVQRSQVVSSLAGLNPAFTVLTAWTNADIITLLPPLPPILDAALEKAAFTHAGMVDSANDTSYEQLEFLGDSYLNVISATLIFETFPTHSPGKMSQIRELLTKNETLASYARRYGFEDRLRLPPDFRDGFHSHNKAKETAKLKVLGDVFEAYTAAVVRSDPQNGFSRVGTWLKSLWTVTIGRQIRDEYERRERESKMIAQSGAKAANPNLKAKDRLRMEIGCKGVEIRYKDMAESKDDKNRPIFTVACVLESGLGQRDRMLAFATAMGKIDAGQLAAQQALDDDKLMAELKGLKAEQLKAEKSGKGLASSRWAD